MILFYLILFFSIARFGSFWFCFEVESSCFYSLEEVIIWDKKKKTKQNKNRETMNKSEREREREREEIKSSKFCL